MSNVWFWPEIDRKLGLLRYKMATFYSTRDLILALIGRDRAGAGSPGSDMLVEAQGKIY